jgi:anti-sigma regulatory factor (Ser/Thr protein kinase)
MDDTHVELVIPLRAEFVSIARLTLSGVANRAGFDFDTIEDVKVALSEVCNRLIGNAERLSAGQRRRGGDQRGSGLQPPAGDAGVAGAGASKAAATGQGVGASAKVAPDQGASAANGASAATNQGASASAAYGASTAAGERAAACAPPCKIEFILSKRDLTLNFYVCTLGEPELAAFENGMEEDSALGLSLISVLMDEFTVNPDASHDAACVVSMKKYLENE